MRQLFWLLSESVNTNKREEFVLDATNIDVNR